MSRKHRDKTEEVVMETLNTEVEITEDEEVCSCCAQSDQDCECYDGTIRRATHAVIDHIIGKRG